MFYRIFENMVGAVSVLAVTAFVSCARSEDQPLERQEVRFNVSETLTKSDAYFSAGDKIGIFAYYLQGGVWDDSVALPDFMYNNPLTLQEDGIWNYSPIMYWPSMPENQLRFYSYFPHADMLDDGELSLSAENKAGSPVLKFRLTNGHTDLLVSEPLQMSRPESDQAVILPFKHSLGQVRFKFSISSSGGFSYITKVKLYGLVSEADLKWDDSGKFFWNIVATSDLEIPSVKPEGFMVSSTGLVPADEFTSYVIPGKITHLGIFQNGVEKKFELTSVSAVEGSVLTFTFNIGLSGVTIDSEVVPWNDGGTSIGGIR